MGKYILFGAGQRGREALNVLDKEEVAFFCDNFKTGSIDGIEIIDYETLEAECTKADYQVVVTTNDILFCLEIAKQLSASGIKFSFLDDTIFFSDKNIIPLKDLRLLLGAMESLLSLKTYIRGNYITWEAACADLPDKYKSGYAQNNILAQVYENTEKVRSGEAAFERDGVLFYQKEYNNNLLASLLVALNHYKGQKVDVLDYGGSLGSSYFQHRDVLENYNYSWNIIEQEGFVKKGKESIPEIEFFYNMSEHIQAGKRCNILILSGVLQYFSESLKTLKIILDCSFEYVIIDRTFFNVANKTRLAIQYVPPIIYDAAYPVALFSREELIDILNECGYEVKYGWDVLTDDIYAEIGNGCYRKVPVKGYLLTRIKTN